MPLRESGFHRGALQCRLHRGVAPCLGVAGWDFPPTPPLRGVRRRRPPRTERCLGRILHQRELDSEHDDLTNLFLGHLPFLFTDTRIHAWMASLGSHAHDHSPLRIAQTRTRCLAITALTTRKQDSAFPPLWNHPTSPGLITADLFLGPELNRKLVASRQEAADHETKQEIPS